MSEQGDKPVHAPDEGETQSASTATRRRKRANMHEGKAVWCDCCSCEAEPRWAAVAEEMGISLSDYEDEI